MLTTRGLQYPSVFTPVQWLGWLFCATLALAAGCTTHVSVDHRSRLATDLYERSGFRLPTEGGSGDSSASLPAEGGLTESQAIDLALANGVLDK